MRLPRRARLRASLVATGGTHQKGVRVPVERIPDDASAITREFRRIVSRNFPRFTAAADPMAWARPEFERVPSALDIIGITGELPPR